MNNSTERHTYWGGKNIATSEIVLTQPILLLVEGSDDFRFFKAFCIKKEMTNVGILDYKGKNNLSKTLEILPLQPGYDQLRAIGITRDADDQNGVEVFKNICHMLQKANFQIPSCFGAFTSGTASPNIGIFVLPDGNKTGELEDLLFETIPKENEIKKCVFSYINCVTNKEIPLKKLAKSHLYSWLACHPSPALRLGEAADKGIFDFDHPCLKKLTYFLDTLNHL